MERTIRNVRLDDFSLRGREREREPEREGKRECSEFAMATRLGHFGTVPGCRATSLLQGITDKSKVGLGGGWMLLSDGAPPKRLHKGNRLGSLIMWLLVLLPQVPSLILDHYTFFH